MKLSFMILILLMSCAHHQQTSITPEFVMEVEGLPGCESVIFDEKSQHYFVSVQGAQVPGDGYLAKVSKTGKIVKRKFTSNLNDPKGIVIHNDKIYVSDLKELLEIDYKTGKILKRYKTDKTEFLNDTAVDENGIIYVSDMFTSIIYKLNTEDEKLEVWLDTMKLENPNGLLIRDGHMYVAAWGKFTDRKPVLSPKGRFMKVSMETKRVKDITRVKLGHLDGVQVYDENSFLVSDWLGGKIFYVDKSGMSQEILNNKEGVGDIYYKDKLLILPMSKEGKLIFYKI